MLGVALAPLVLPTDGMDQGLVPREMDQPVQLRSADAVPVCRDDYEWNAGWCAARSDPTSCAVDAVAANCRKTCGICSDPPAAPQVPPTVASGSASQSELSKAEAGSNDNDAGSGSSEYESGGEAAADDVEDTDGIIGGCGSHEKLPGLDSIGIGFDAVRGTRAGVGLRVARYKCSLGKTFRSANGMTYAVPDAVKVTGASRNVDVTKVFRSKTEYSTSESSSTGVTAGFGFFSSSVETSQTQQEIGNKENIVVETSTTIALFTATLDEPKQLILDESFKSAVDALPAIYNRSASPLTEPYWMLIRYYGTHYVRYAQFGGTVKMKNIVTQSYVEKKSDSSVAVEASGSYAGMSAGASNSNSESSSNSEFSKNSQTTTSQIGGNPAIKALSGETNGTSDAFTDWVDSISVYAPAQVAYRLDDLWRLVPNPLKAKHLRLAIEDYASNTPCRPGGCLSGAKFLGGVQLVDERCQQFCSPYGFCGTTEDYQSGEGATDCSEFNPNRIYNPPPEQPPPSNPICDVDGCEEGDRSDGGVKLVDGRCMQICSAAGKCGTGPVYSDEGSSDCRSEAKQPQPPNPRPECEVHLSYKKMSDEVMTFTSSKARVKEGDKNYENQIEAFMLKSNPDGSGACRKLIVYDEDNKAGCGNAKDSETYEGDFTWRELPNDVYHDSACFTVEVNEDPEWVAYCGKEGTFQRGRSGTSNGSCLVRPLFSGVFGALLLSVSLLAGQPHLCASSTG